MANLQNTRRPPAIGPTRRTVTRSIWRLPAVWLLLPLGMCALVIGLIATSQLQAARAIRQEIDSLRAAGLPVDNESAAAYFASQTDRAGTPDWSKAIRLVDNQWIATLGAELPYIGNATLPIELDPAAEWQTESQVAEFLTKLQPAIAHLHRAEEHPTPVWQPVQFQGLATLLGHLQASRSMISLLLLDAEYALRLNDTARAMQDLKTAQVVVEAFDWPVFAVSKWIALFSQERIRNLIRRSMSANVWSLDEIEQLRGLVGPPVDVEQLWPALLASDRSMLLVSLRNREELRAAFGEQPRFVDALLAVPSVQWEMLERAQAWEQIASSGLPGMLDRAERLAAEQAADAEGLMHSLVEKLAGGAWYPGVIKLFQVSEDERRFALVVLAVKQFQLEQHQWPERPSQLESVGLGPSDWTTVAAGQFGYRVLDEVAYVWSYTAKQPDHVPAEMPEQPDRMNPSLDASTEVVVIR